MNDDKWPDTWAPYMTWSKHQEKATFDLSGSNLLPCTLDEFPEALSAVALYGRNDNGWPPLIEAISSRYKVSTDRIATGPGASGANFLALAALLRPGDTLLTEWPGYDPHMGVARFIGANVATFDRSWSRDFSLTPDAVEAALTPDVGAIMLTNLHNPSGVYATSEALARVGELARSVNARVVVDEVYLDALQETDHAPVATRDDVFVSTNSLTKSYGLAGVRVGWLIAEPEIVRRALRVRDILDGVGSIPSETIGAVAFQHLDRLLERAREILGPGAERFRSFMGTRSDLEWIVPIGGSVAFPRLLGVGDTRPFVNFAAKHFGVGVTPGSLFGEPKHFRVSVAGDPLVLDQGLAKLGEALDAWDPEAS